ncbi:MAG: hypothetical protein JNK82_08545 [Myxococcaceae bacterium]|nr:hypothetical protein [Myxococcaceae bacterium]
MLAVAVSLYGGLYLREALPEPAKRVAQAQQPVPATPAPTPLLPLPRLTVKTDAGVEVKRRGATAEAGCATGGTSQPLCPGQYDVRATTPTHTALAVIWLERGETKELDLTLTPTATVELTLLDSEKLPVDRARVTAQHVTTGYLLEGRSDSDGTVSLGPAVPGDYRVVASREGWATGAGLASAGRNTTLELPLLKSLDGALDPPAPGVPVSLRTPEHVEVARVVADRGAFSFPLLAEGRYELAVDSPDYLPRVEPVTVPPKDPVVLRLSPGATLTLDVHSVTPTVFAPPRIDKKTGAAVPPPAPERLPDDGTVHTVTLEGPGRTRTLTTRDGALEVRGLEPGRWVVASGRTRITVDLKADTATRAELDVPRYPGTMTGTCTFRGGHRLPANVTVLARTETKEVWSTADCSSGTFELKGLQSGFYALEVEAREGGDSWSGQAGAHPTGSRDVAVQVPGVAWFHWRVEGADGRLLSSHQLEHFGSRDVEVPELDAPFFVPRTVRLERGEDTDAGVFRSAEGVKLTGRVVDAVSKQPLEAAEVSAGRAHFVTRADGAFDAELPEGTHLLTLAHAGHVTGTQVVEVPGEPGTFELTRAARAVGTVVTADGRPADGLEVWAISERGTLRAPVTQNRFATPPLTDGRWLLRVAGEGLVSAFDTADVDVKGAGDRVVQLVERAAGVTFEVAVVDGAGAAAEADLLLVPRAQTAPQNDLELERLLRLPGLVADGTARAARYRFSAVPPGGYTVVARSRHHAWTLAMPVVVEPGMRPVGVAFPHTPYSPLVKRDSR